MDQRETGKRRRMKCGARTHTHTCSGLYLERTPSPWNSSSTSFSFLVESEEERGENSIIMMMIIIISVMVRRLTHGHVAPSRYSKYTFLKQLEIRNIVWDKIESMSLTMDLVDTRQFDLQTWNGTICPMGHV